MRVPVLEHAGDVALGRDVLRCGEHATSTASTCSSPRPRKRGDVERVREEVALRVAEVGAVEPHVGLVEDPVERHPGGARRRPAPRSNAAIQERAVARGELRLVRANGPEPRSRVHAVVVGVEADRRRDAARRRPRPLATTPVSSIAGTVPTASQRCSRVGDTRVIHRDRGIGFDTMGARQPHSGELRASGWESRPVKEEIRANAVAKIAAGEPLFDGCLGYEHTVMPQLENALLAGHDVIFLGERGQAKTRMIRSLTGLLDEWMPIVAGSEINDDPVSSRCRGTPATSSPSSATTRRSSGCTATTASARSSATPDTSIADLIGEVDPIKVAEGRYLADELTLHYGLVPRTNRGIFAINEIPDLAERIQVGLLNVLEERDVQVRGYKIRLPLDVMLVASANPEDYTNRGRIITPAEGPLRQPDPHALPARRRHRGRDHAPGGAARSSVGDVPVTVPEYLGAGDRHVQPPGPGEQSRQPAQRCERAPERANHEVLAANALRRGLRAGERVVVARVGDLEALAATSIGKIEIESLEEGRDGAILENLVKGAVLTVYKDRVDARSGP